MDDIRAAFRIEKLRAVVKRNLDQLQVIFNTRSDIVDKAKSSILSTIGAVLTTISVISLLTDPEQHFSLVLASLCVGLFILSKNLVFRRALKQKRK